MSNNNSLSSHSRFQHTSNHIFPACLFQCPVSQLRCPTPDHTQVFPLPSRAVYRYWFTNKCSNWWKVNSAISVWENRLKPTGISKETWITEGEKRARTKWNRKKTAYTHGSKSKLNWSTEVALPDIEMQSVPHTLLWNFGKLFTPVFLTSYTDMLSLVASLHRPSPRFPYNKTWGTYTMSLKFYCICIPLTTQPPLNDPITIVGANNSNCTH